MRLIIAIMLLLSVLQPKAQNFGWLDSLHSLHNPHYTVDTDGFHLRRLDSDTTPYLIDSGNLVWYTTTPKYDTTYDTIPVKLLVSDTTEFRPPSYTINGYAIVEQIKDINKDYVSFKLVVGYLNRFRRRLSPMLMIWDAK